MRFPSPMFATIWLRLFNLNGKSGFCSWVGLTNLWFVCLFHDGCSKHAFKCIRTRMAPIRRKKHAMIRFLKKDVADLLANGLDTHAFGRVCFFSSAGRSVVQRCLCIALESRMGFVLGQKRVRESCLWV